MSSSGLWWVDDDDELFGLIVTILLAILSHIASNIEHRLLVQV
jgi:hypothetical protein